MNLRPTEVPDVLGDQSRYSLVIAVAKRARQISEEAEKRGEIIVEKPVDLAVQDMMQHQFKIVPSQKAEETAESGNNAE